MWNRDAAGTWQALAGHQWGARAAPLADAVAERLRARAAALLEAAYARVPAARAAALLGLSEADARDLAARLGWGVENGGALLVPRARGGGAAGAGGGAGGSAGVAQLDCRAALEQLAGYMVHLES